MVNQLPTELHGIFPCPVYIAKRDVELSSKEDKDIEDIIKKGMYKNFLNSTSKNSYIFNDKLKNIKQFCEQQIKIYVEAVINPVGDLDFYITQSWLNITKPGESHHTHFHPNSIISGVFYISTVENDMIDFVNPLSVLGSLVQFDVKKYNLFNSGTWFFNVNNNDLLLFPSWLNHQVKPNDKATKDRISISFNTFVKGTLGGSKMKTELILK
jgi:uncharacterized protein (TIGR02466 family)